MSPTESALRKAIRTTVEANVQSIVRTHAGPAVEKKNRVVASRGTGDSILHVALESFALVRQQVSQASFQYRHVSRKGSHHKVLRGTFPDRICDFLPEWDPATKLNSRYSAMFVVYRLVDLSPIGQWFRNRPFSEHPEARAHVCGFLMQELGTSLQTSIDSAPELPMQNVVRKNLDKAAAARAVAARSEALSLVRRAFRMSPLSEQEVLDELRAAQVEKVLTD